jgi:general secretion pathway protein G
MNRAPRHGWSPNAFSLIEVLIVVVILAIVGALVVPQYSNAARLSRESALREDLRFIRSQLQVYRAQHNGVAPGYPLGNIAAAPTEHAFVAQMTGPTSASGAVGAAVDQDHPFGPYMRVMPANPFNDLRLIRIVGPGPFPDDPGDAHGWVYQPATMKFHADCAGADDGGKRYFDY